MKPVVGEQLPPRPLSAKERRGRRRAHERRRWEERLRGTDRGRLRLIPLKEDILRDLAARARNALCRSRGVVACVQEAEACLLARATQRKLHAKTGHVRFGDFCAEVLRLEPRTARRRIELLGVIDRHTALRDAFRKGDLGFSQALALAPVVNAENALEWIGVAEGLSAHRLRARVHEALGNLDARAGDTRDDPRVCVAFSAPPTAGLAFEHGLETTRRVLGWDAPRGECLAAILAEAEASLPGEGEAADQETGHGGDAEGDSATGVGGAAGVGRGEEPGSPCCRRQGEPRGERARLRPSAPESDRRRGREPDIRCSDAQLKALRKLLRRYERRLDYTLRVIGNLLSAPSDLHLVSFLDAWKTLQALSRPLYVLETRLLLRFHAAMAAESLGFANVVDFLVRERRVSDRTAQTLLLHGRVFECLPRFRQAFIHGSLGKGQIDLLNRSVLNLNPKWLERAARLTHRQLARETRLLHRLAELEPDTFSPLFIPHWDFAESLLRRQLFHLGFSPENLDTELDAMALLDPDLASRDPAENPLLMSRLETLLDLVILTREETEPAPPGPGGDRDPGPGGDRDPGPGSDRPKTVSSRGHHHRVLIWAEAFVHDQWHRLLARVRRHRGWLPAWAAAVLLLNAAVTTWQEIHEEFEPTQHRILERDGYRCRAPGCSARRGLEVHHIDYRSHQGSEEPWNKITLCAPHHRHAVHTGWLWIRGRAPHDLTWTMGDDRRWVYRGDRLVRRV